jgi:hypothetical protein
VVTPRAKARSNSDCTVRSSCKSDITPVRHVSTGSCNGSSSRSSLYSSNGSSRSSLYSSNGSSRSSLFSSSGRNSPHSQWGKFSTRTSQYHKNCVGHGPPRDPPREPYQARYERYRQSCK